MYEASACSLNHCWRGYVEITAFLSSQRDYLRSTNTPIQSKLNIVAALVQCGSHITWRTQARGGFNIQSHLCRRSLALYQEFTHLFNE